jgi:hypothetical protein
MESGERTSPISRPGFNGGGLAFYLCKNVFRLIFLAEEVKE